MCACTQARIGRCLGVGYKLVRLYAVRQDGTRQWIKQRGRYVIVIVTVCGAGKQWKIGKGMGRRVRATSHPFPNLPLLYKPYTVNIHNSNISLFLLCPLLDHCLLSSARLNHVTLNAQTAWFSDNTCLTTRGNPSGLVCCCCCCYCSDRRSREVICCSRRRHRPQRSRSWCELDKDIWLC
jgi:hypothetical protein